MKHHWLAAVLPLGVVAPAFAWEPTKPIEIVVPFSAGGASDQMARTIQGIIQKHQFTTQPIIVVNKPAAGGAEGMLDIQKSAGDPHKLITTSSGIFMTPMATKLALNWTDYTPVAMLAQDSFLLWVNAKAPYKSAGDLIAAAKGAATPLKIGGTSSKREDNLIVFAMEKVAGTKFAYIPYTSGGQASTQLSGGHVEANTNNPAEDLANWRGGATRPLCVFAEQKMAYTEKVADGQSWADIPTCASQGLDVSYQMLRGMFMPGKVSKDQQAFYTAMFKKVSETPEWKDYLARNALVPDYRDGEAFVTFLKADEAKHARLMTEAGFMAK
ncbi:tripartite tricarboxylate transporter substrate-binding protein [Bosea sp. (in: a-proteobacteria)]|jgi:tripartite-type tricarboxylate transporter receptor subunit TctC|uniref:Bug family tripartite tricarboxylate transporter substrate binding protein n=1 Tax=Bosea vestrisii TaxID=151416 RepID=A0ABW0HNR2_9HYPH|nr:tripartite tricarboxylate transporter substrate-binding protein [Bosea sp. (in: a-proteobacteria)]MBA4224388.1 tricarboxylate transporter [Methylobacterium sp.]MBR3190365.1 tripartite tricarboxylate transporter substrate binding protein [Bosea sp. (in: a-proteobacteria)]